MTPATWLPVLLLALGIGLVASGALRLKRLRASRDWPNTEGEVLVSTVNRRLTSPGGATGVSHIIYPRIVYRYTVDGHDYQGSVIELGGRFRMTASQAAERAREFPEGARVPVHYDPTRPERACLLRTGAGGVAHAVGGAALIVGALALLLA